MKDLLNSKALINLPPGKVVVKHKEGGKTKVYGPKDGKLEFFTFDQSWNFVDNKGKVLASFPYDEMKDKNSSPTLPKEGEMFPRPQKRRHPLA